MATETPADAPPVDDSVPVDTETTMADFFKNNVLHDISLTNPNTKAEIIKAHKAILASGSTYFLEVFRTNPKDADGKETLTYIEVPKPVKTCSQTSTTVSDEHVLRILKFIYNNQNFNCIKEGINDTNMSGIYAQAYVLKCKNLLTCLDDMIVNVLLKPQNATLFYLDAVQFKNEKIRKACETLLCQQIDAVLKTEASSLHLLELPFQQLKEFCESDKLELTNEKDLLDLFERYLKAREKLPLLPEEDPAQDWTHLTPEEKEGRKKLKEEKELATKVAKEEEEKTAQAAYDALDPMGKINANWSKKVDLIHKSCVGELAVKRLTKDQKKELFKTVRFGFMKHEDLLSLTANKTFELAKDFIVEGLSVKLNKHENAKQEDHKINVSMRAHLKKKADKEKAEKDKVSAAVGGFAKGMNQGLGVNANPAQVNKTGLDNQYKQMLQGSRDIKSAGPGLQQPVAFNQTAGAGQFNQQMQQTQPNFNSQTMGPGSSTGFGGPGQKPAFGPIPPMKPHTEQLKDAQKKSQDFADRPYEFVFQSHFDEEGALFYLGSFGKRRLYQNPHTVGQIQAFSSSIGSGRPEDFVGRQVVNCRTGNEPFSYFGVDLGEGRQLLPTCYTFRNRNITTHVMLNWHFEGSNDKVNWTVLDRRLYLTGNPSEDQAFEEEKRILCQKGAATTWGVDTDIYREIGFDGFRYFRMIQVGKNSSGSDNLALSGLELYGRVICGRWP